MRKLVLLLSLLCLTAGCNLPWVKKSPYTREELAAFRDKDVYIIDGERYLKVRDERGEIRFVTVRDYLRHPMEVVPLREATVREESPRGWEVRKEARAPVERRLPVAALPAPAFLKRKVAILPFEEGTSSSLPWGSLAAEVCGELLAVKALSVIVVDDEVLKAALRKLRIPMEGALRPENLRRIGSALGVQAVVTGTVYGPFSSRGGGFVEVKLQVYDTLKGDLLDEFPLQATSQGEGRELLRKALQGGISKIEGLLEEMGWFTRVALVEGDKVYLFAGGESGLKEGDLLEVYSPLDHRRKGRVEVSRLFGVDASMAKGVEGEGFTRADLVLFYEEGRRPPEQASKP